MNNEEQAASAAEAMRLNEMAALGVTQEARENTSGWDDDAPGELVDESDLDQVNELQGDEGV